MQLQLVCRHRFKSWWPPGLLTRCLPWADKNHWRALIRVAMPPSHARPSIIEQREFSQAQAAHLAVNIDGWQAGRAGKMAIHKLSRSSRAADGAVHQDLFKIGSSKTRGQKLGAWSGWLCGYHVELFLVSNTFVSFRSQGTFRCAKCATFRAHCAMAAEWRKVAQSRKSQEKSQVWNTLRWKVHLCIWVIIYIFLFK